LRFLHVGKNRAMRLLSLIATPARAETRPGHFLFSPGKRHHVLLLSSGGLFSCADVLRARFMLLTRGARHAQ